MHSPSTDAVAIAVTYIQNHFHRSLYVEEIAKHVGLSRWHLQRLFLKQRGYSLVEEINRTRLRRAKELLAGTDLPTAEVARLCGFERREYFSVVFSRHVGESPALYRRHSQPARSQPLPLPPLPALGNVLSGPQSAPNPELG
jgi:AraC-like DNA-binding protein